MLLQPYFGNGSSPRSTHIYSDKNNTYVIPGTYIFHKIVSSYIAQYPILRIAQSALYVTSLAYLFNQGTILTSLGSIQPYAAINAQRLLVHTSTTVYSQVLIYTAE